jgi:uncharacterized Zn-finger protein
MSTVVNSRAFPPMLSDPMSDALEMFDMYDLVTPVLADPLQIEMEEEEEAVLAASDPKHPNVCLRCGKSYKHSSHLIQHEKYECDKPPRFGCFYCSYRSKRKTDIRRHIRIRHQDKDFRYNVQPD